MPTFRFEELPLWEFIDRATGLAVRLSPVTGDAELALDRDGDWFVAELAVHDPWNDRIVRLARTDREFEHFERALERVHAASIADLMGDHGYVPPRSDQAEHSTFHHAQQGTGGFRAALDLFAAPRADV